MKMKDLENNCSGVIVLLTLFTGVMFGTFVYRMKIHDMEFTTVDWFIAGAICGLSIPVVCFGLFFLGVFSHQGREAASS